MTPSTHRPTAVGSDERGGGGRTRLRRTLALLTGTALAAGLVATASVPAYAATTSIDSKKILELKFDGDLKDSSPKAASISMQKGNAAYGAGVVPGDAANRSFKLDGSNAIKLGTAAYLQPADLTASFWFKPNSAMTGEQVFTWSKTAYNSDGWYLTSESEGTPLALSIGPSGGQPYKVAVDAPRSTFFPTDAWTHIAVTYDKATKAVTMFRNGVKLQSVVKNGVGGDATGVLGSESTSTKTIGYNGPQYNGAHANGLLDDYTLYDGVASIKDVVAIVSERNPAFDPTAVAKAEIDTISVPGAVGNSFSVPTVGTNGTELTWTSSDPSVVAINGGEATVTRAASKQTVTLTVSGTYGGSAASTRTFPVEVLAEGIDSSLYLMEAGLSDVTVTDPYLVNAGSKTIDYLLSLDPEKFLYSWYVNAGLKPTTDSSYGGWEASSGNRFQGHFFGHYITALSQSYATTEDATKKAALLAKLTAAVDGLKKVQDAYAAKDPTNAGYAAPFPVDYLPHGKDGLIVPFYNLHKVVAGLNDAHKYAPKAVADKALAVNSAFGTWVTNWASRQSDPSGLLRTEYGGMNEALYVLYEQTGDPKHKRAAEYFDETALFENLAAGRDVLGGLHANTTIPKLTGALKRYQVFTDNPHLYAQLSDAEKGKLDMYRVAAEKFWQIVVDDHTYANGANSQSEHFHAPGTLFQVATNGSTSGYGENSTAEGCNEYNMLKLTRALFQVSKDVKYADYYESTYINTILASQNPETGMVTYFQPMTAGYAKVFGKPLDEFWCDHGSGIESFTKLGDSFYFEESGAVYVTQFRSSEFRSSALNLKLTQTADVPNSETVTYAVAGLDGGALAEGASLKLRVPGWVKGAPTLTVNGAVQDVAALNQGGFLTVPVKVGDKLSYTLPAAVSVSADTENPNWVAFKYGPVLLATELNRSNVDATYQAGILVRMSVADKSVSNNVVVADSEAWKTDVEKNLVRLPNGKSANGLETMRFGMKNVDSAAAARVFEPFYSLYNARYGMYMTLIEPDSQAAQAQILRDKQQLRVAETTIDSLTSFDNNNSEAGKNYTFNNSTVGVHLGQAYRDADRSAGSFFQYEMAVDPSQPKNYLGARYFSGDVGRQFDIKINGQKLKTVVVNANAGRDQFYIEWDEIPAAAISSIAANDAYKRDKTGAYALDSKGDKIPIVTVRFEYNGSGSYVGGLFGLYTANSTTFSSDAGLSKLAFSAGTLSPTFAKATREYTLTVPNGTTSVDFDADPVTPSGLVKVGDILIDDTQSRTVKLADGDTTLALNALAQDHETQVAYTVKIVKAAAVAPLKVSAVATTRCVAGAVQLTVTTTNQSEVSTTVTQTTPYGAKSFPGVAPGKTVSQSYSTRAKSVAAGSVAAKVSVTENGATRSADATASFGARSC